MLTKPVLHSTSTMATSSNSSTTIPSPSPIISGMPRSCRSAQLQDFLTGFEKEPSKTLSKKVGDTVVDEPNPAHALWVSCNQAVLGYLFTSLSHEVLTGVATLTSSVKVWLLLLRQRRFPCPRWWSRSRCGRGRGTSHPPHFGNNNNSKSGSCSTDIRPHCKVRLRLGHTTNICWYRFDEEYLPEPKSAAAASTSHRNDPS
jgi:hypothetical protein